LQIAAVCAEAREEYAELGNKDLTGLKTFGEGIAKAGPAAGTRCQIWQPQWQEVVKEQVGAGGSQAPSALAALSMSKVYGCSGLGTPQQQLKQQQLGAAGQLGQEEGVC